MVNDVIRRGIFQKYLAPESQNNVIKITSNSVATLVVNKTFSRQGWDPKYRGLLYFIDADDFPPTQLEWNMKLWWPHNEAMIAFLMAFQHDGSPEHLKTFNKVATYAFEKVRNQ